MTIKQANDIFRSKYPDGKIEQRGCMSKTNKVSINVTYQKGGKVYYYNAQNYVELLNRMGFRVVYKKDVEALEIAIYKMQKVIADGGENNIFSGGFVKLSENKKQRLLNTIAEYQDSINHSIVVD
uniref:Uncharacterized protein n=1 Tax=Dulem virus 39 TaxID=3145757 RepID=A0AAU8B9D3_9CAUD